MPNRKYLFLQRSQPGNQTAGPSSRPPRRCSRCLPRTTPGRRSSRTRFSTWATSSCPGHGGDHVRGGGRPVRRGQGDRGRLHDRLRRELRWCGSRSRGHARADARRVAWRSASWRALERRLRDRTAIPAHTARAWSNTSSGTSTAGWWRCSRAGSGVRHLERVEDAVQGALLAALTAWTARAFPTTPAPGCTAWRTTSCSAAAKGASRHQILERAATRRRQRRAPAPAFSRAKSATSCCACCSSAATTPFRGSRGWCSR